MVSQLLLVNQNQVKEMLNRVKSFFKLVTVAMHLEVLVVTYRWLLVTYQPTVILTLKTTLEEELILLQELVNAVQVE